MIHNWGINRNYFCFVCESALRSPSLFNLFKTSIFNVASYILKEFYRRCSAICVVTQLPGLVMELSKAGTSHIDRWPPGDFLPSRTSTVQPTGEIRAISWVGNDVMKNTEKKIVVFSKGPRFDLSELNVHVWGFASQENCLVLTILYIHCMLTSLTLSPDSSNMVLLSYLSIWPACPECINYCRIYS